MKKDTHPKYQQVLFVDSATGYKFLCGSTLKTDDTSTFEGKEFPVCQLAISSASHPLFTGSKQFVDAEGRVDKFRKRYAAKQNQGEESKEETPESGKKPAAKKIKK